jgi:hypothetical protein
VKASSGLVGRRWLVRRDGKYFLRTKDDAPVPAGTKEERLQAKAERLEKSCLIRNASNCNSLSKKDNEGYKPCVWNSRRGVCFPSSLSSNNNLGWTKDSDGAKQYITNYRARHVHEAP